jgi:hypothetical protein
MSMQIDMAVPAVALKLMTLKKEVMASVLSAGVRLNDATLRKKEDDKVGELLKKVRAKSQQQSEPSPAEEVTKAELFS